MCQAEALGSFTAYIPGLVLPKLFMAFLGSLLGRDGATSPKLLKLWNFVVKTETIIVKSFVNTQLNKTFYGRNLRIGQVI